ncbi:hypothetical protein BKA56DRAFT_138379 [Ilyonectria sp. MPI-CAGE-AT-0026]|nr:hypothetical protein BKA56DRAFT_138379 [Ilyonectria sp. MPI-CAGE-AT-0026]
MAPGQLRRDETRRRRTAGTVLAASSGRGCLLSPTWMGPSAHSPTAAAAACHRYLRCQRIAMLQVTYRANMVCSGGRHLSQSNPASPIQPVQSSQPKPGTPPTGRTGSGECIEVKGSSRSRGCGRARPPSAVSPTRSRLDGIFSFLLADGTQGFPCAVRYTCVLLSARSRRWLRLGRWLKLDAGEVSRLGPDAGGSIRPPIRSFPSNPERCAC